MNDSKIATPRGEHGAATVDDGPDREAAVLLGTLVHDIRTPLSAMAGWLEVLESQLGESACLVERALTGLRRGIVSQTQIVNTMAETLARREAGAPCASKPRSFGAVLDGAVDALLARADEAGPAGPRRRALAPLAGRAGTSTMSCADGGESLVSACCVLLEALAAVQGDVDPPLELHADGGDRIRLRAPVGSGDRSAIRALCAGLHRAGARRPEIAPQALWLARSTLNRSGLAVAIDERLDGLVVTLSPLQGMAASRP